MKKHSDQDGDALERALACDFPDCDERTYGISDLLSHSSHHVDSDATVSAPAAKRPLAPINDIGTIDQIRQILDSPSSFCFKKEGLDKLRGPHDGQLTKAKRHAGITSSSVKHRAASFAAD